jgi:hypothetical protein
MYFSGKSYFNPTIIRDVEIRTGISKGTNTNLNKPKSRKKGKLTRKTKAKRKFNLTQLKKQLGNDMVIKLLLRLVEGKAGARPVGRPAQQPQTTKQPRKMRLARGSGLPGKEKQKLEKKKQGETEQQFFKRVEDFVLENNPAFLYFSQILQQDRERAEALIREQIDALRGREVPIAREAVDRPEIDPRFVNELLRRLRVSEGNIQERERIVREGLREYRQAENIDLDSSDEEKFYDLARTTGKKKRDTKSANIQQKFGQSGQERRKGRERRTVTTETTTLGELGGEALSSAESSLISGLTSDETSGGEALSRFQKSGSFRRPPENPLDRGGLSPEEEKQRLAQQFQPNPAPAPIGRPSFESQGLKTKTQLEKEAKQPTYRQEGDTKVIGGGAVAGFRKPGRPKAGQGESSVTVTREEEEEQEEQEEQFQEDETEEEQQYAPFSSEQVEQDLELLRPIPTETFDERLREQERERRFAPLQKADTGEVEVAATDPTYKVGRAVTRVKRGGIGLLQKTQVEKGLGALQAESQQISLAQPISFSIGESGTETDVSAPDLQDSFGFSSGSDTEYSEQEKDLDFQKFKYLPEKQQEKAFSRLQGQLKVSDKELQKQVEEQQVYRGLLDSDDERQAQEVIQINRQSQSQLAQRQSVSGLPQDTELSQLNLELLSGSETSITSSLFREAEADFDFTQPTPPGSVSSFNLSSQSEPERRVVKRKVKKSVNIFKREIDDIDQKIDDLQLSLGQGASTGGMTFQAEGKTEEDIRTEIEQLQIEKDILEKQLEKREKQQAKRKQPEPESALTSESEAETGQFLQQQQKLGQKQQTLTKAAQKLLPKLESEYETLLKEQEQELVDESIEVEDKKAKQTGDLFEFRGKIEDEIYKLNKKSPEEEQLVNRVFRADIALKLLEDPENEELILFEELYGDLYEYTGIPTTTTAKETQALVKDQRKRYKEAETRLREFEADRREALEGVKSLESDSRRKQSELYNTPVEKPFRIDSNIKGQDVTPKDWKEYESEVLGYFVSKGKLTEEERQQIINADTKKRKEIIEKLKGAGNFRREWLLPKEKGEYERWWKSYVTANLKELNPQQAGRKPRTEEEKAQGGSSFKAQFKDFMITRLDGVTPQQYANVNSRIETFKSKNQKIAKLFSGESQGIKERQSAFETLEKEINKALLTSGDGQSKSEKNQKLEKRDLNTFVGDIVGDDLKYFVFKKGSLVFGGGTGISITTVQDEKNKAGSVYRVTDTKENKRYMLRVMKPNKYRLEEDTENNDTLVSKRKVIMAFN